MKKIHAVFGALLLAGSVFTTVQPAKADVVVGFSFGGPEVADIFGSPCYGPGPCGYQVYREPVYIDGAWYRGPIYSRWENGRRLYWYHGAWRRDEWRGSRPRNIEWRDWRRSNRQWNDGWRGNRDWHERNDRRDRDRDHRDRDHGRDRDHDRDPGHDR
jgi:hypothetical protein